MPLPPDTRAPSPTFAEAWALWLAHRIHSTRSLRASTLADYESIYRRHLGPAFATMPLDELDATAIVGFTIARRQAGVSAKRLSNVLVPLRACLRWHHRLGTLDPDPSPWFDASAPAADERRILTPTQVERLIAELPQSHRPMIAFAAYTGVRAGELRALTWADVDLATRTARIDKTYYRDRLQRSTKTGRDRTVPIPRHVAGLLGEWAAHCPDSPEGLVFPGPAGRPLDLDTFRARVFKPALRRAGLPETVRIHDLRHTSASWYLQSGATLREVMAIHGWTQLQTAVRYLHVADELTAAADRLSDAREAALALPAHAPATHPPAARPPPSGPSPRSP